MGYHGAPVMLTGRTGKMHYQIELSMFNTKNHTNSQIRGVFGHRHLGTWFSRSTTAVSIWWDIAIVLCNLDMPTMEKGYMLQPIPTPRCLQVVCCITFHQMKAIQLKMPGVAGTTTPNFKSSLFGVLFCVYCLVWPEFFLVCFGFLERNTYTNSHLWDFFWPIWKWSPNWGHNTFRDYSKNCPFIQSKNCYLSE